MRCIGQRTYDSDVLDAPNAIVDGILKHGENYRSTGESFPAEEEFAYCRDAYKTTFNHKLHTKKIGNQTIKTVAREDSKSRGKGVPVISWHVSSKGTRQYYVSSWPHFVKSIYSKMKAEEQCFYENIYEEDPCRLYIDIDLDISDVVPEGSTESAVKIFEAYTERLHQHVVTMVLSLKKLLEALYPSTTVTDAFLLDSSSHFGGKRKFSHHVIFHLDGDSTFFKGSKELLRLFNYIKQTSLVCEAKGVDQTSNPFFWPSDIKSSFLASYEKVEVVDVPAPSALVPLDERDFIADFSVLGNTVREFRIVGSTKHSEWRHFTLTEHAYFVNPTWKLHPVNFDRPQYDFDTFGRLLVCFVRSGVPVTKLLIFYIENSTALNAVIASFCAPGSEPCAKKRKILLSATDRSDSRDPVIEDDFCTTADMKRDYDAMPPLLKKLFDSYSDEKKREYVFEIVANDIVRQNPQLSHGDIAWTRYVTRKGSFAVSYRTNSKYCEIKGDEHTNNHVFYVAWLASKEYYQRCWNSECRRSKERTRARFEVDRTSKKDVTNNNNNNNNTDGDAENDCDDNADEEIPSGESSRRLYEDARNLKTCKSDTRLLGMTTWEVVQEYVNVQRETIYQYKKWKEGTATIADVTEKETAPYEYEIEEEINLSIEEEEEKEEEEGGKKEEVRITEMLLNRDYKPTCYYREDPILNDLFPDSK